MSEVPPKVVGVDGSVPAGAHVVGTLIGGYEVNLGSKIPENQGGPAGLVRHPGREYTTMILASMALSLGAGLLIKAAARRIKDYVR